MANAISEHIVDGVSVRVFNLPSGAYCALVVSNDVVFQATFNAELKPISIVSDHLKQLGQYELPAMPPDQEMLTAMKLATLMHMHSKEAFSLRST